MGSGGSNDCYCRWLVQRKGGLARPRLFVAFVDRGRLLLGLPDLARDLLCRDLAYGILECLLAGCSGKTNCGSACNVRSVLPLFPLERTSPATITASGVDTEMTRSEIGCRDERDSSFQAGDLRHPVRS